MSDRVTRGRAMIDKDKGKRKKEDGESSRRKQPKQPKPKLNRNVDYDSDPDDEDSYYDPASKPLERELGFSIPTRGMFHNLQLMVDMKIENTRMVCMKSLEALGVADDFRRLTSAMGFQDRFWRLNLVTYRLPTLEFLSSVDIKWNEKERKNYIKFRLSNATHRLNITDMAGFMGFDSDFTHEPVVYRDDWQKPNFWKMITGLEEPMRFKTRFIHHPVIRITQRILAQTIFARGESSNQLNDEEGYLLDGMLREDIPKPYLGLLMAQHWIKNRNKGRSGGSVTMGAYVTLIARSLNIDIETSETCNGPNLMTCKWFSDVHFIKIVTENRVVRYKWKMEGREDLYLPYTGAIDHRPNTWLVPIDYEPITQGGGHGEPPHEEAPMPADEEPQQHEPHPSYMPQPPYQSDIPHEQPAWFTQFLNLALSTSEDAREARRYATQNAEGIARLNERVDIIESNQHDWNFRYDHGYWQGGDNDPNLHVPRQLQQDEEPQEQPARLSAVHDFSMP